MTLQDCYGQLKGDYSDAIGRLRSEKLLQKFVLKFLDDGSYDLLCRSLEEGNHDEAFRASHTIKGMCQNLSFTTLAESSSALTEALRAGETDTAGLFAKVQEDYQNTADAIRAFQAELAG